MDFICASAIGVYVGVRRKARVTPDFSFQHQVSCTQLYEKPRDLFKHHGKMISSALCELLFQNAAEADCYWNLQASCICIRMPETFLPVFFISASQPKR
jgi:hypothetical protein